MPWITGLLLLTALLVFLLVTPAGLLAKADMIGYAVCHQIDSHSFSFAGSHLPLCARCTGTFLGALVGLLGQAAVLRRRRASTFPPVPILVVLVAFTGLWAADGVNAYLALIGGPHPYEPTNQLRLITGVLNGVTMSALVYPVVNVSLWRSPGEERAIRGLRDLGLVLLMEAGMAALVLSGRDVLLFPLALVSAVAVLTLLTSVNTVLAVMILGRETTVEAWQDARLPLAVGLLLTFVQIGVIDVLRYALTGTLEGFPSL